MKKIKIACQTKDFLNLNEIEPFQKNLKSLSDKDFKALRHEILETGFAFPVYVWKSPEETNFCLGGHQRLRVLKQLSDEGYEVSVPVVYIQADTLKQAKRRILQDASQYGKVEKQGLYEFAIENEFDPGDLANFKLPEIDWPSFNEEFFLDSVTGLEEVAPEKVGAKELSEDSFSAFDHKCPRCGFEFD